ncbi:MAG: signal recognition particle-docking protein FtsY [Clostridia bacterium]|nr:signal recognition particle-docking protein FtsY [Clostridia bacterium]
MGFFDKLKQGLTKTKNTVFSPINTLLRSMRKVDEELLEELEEILICADTGMETAQAVISALRERIKDDKIKDADEVTLALKEIMTDMLGEESPLVLGETKPSVILVIGVNGVGKTTSIAKIANLLKSEGNNVLLCAADTFRAAAIDQLQIWADRCGVDLIKHTEGSDPAAVVFDAACAAKSRGSDVLIIDTAGRLHNKKNLMDELSKISRVLDRELPGSKRETLLVLDATTGQNAINQAYEFTKTSEITGLVLTKLDGTAKGGCVLSINSKLGIPVKFIGVGEAIDDMQRFVPKDFVNALFEN